MIFLDIFQKYKDKLYAYIKKNKNNHDEFVRANQWIIDKYVFVFATQSIFFKKFIRNISGFINLTRSKYKIKIN